MVRVRCSSPVVCLWAASADCNDRVVALQKSEAMHENRSEADARKPRLVDIHLALGIGGPFRGCLVHGHYALMVVRQRSELRRQILSAGHVVLLSIK